MTTAIRSLPKFLQLRTNATQTFLSIGDRTAAHRQLSMPKVMKKKKVEEPEDKDIKREHDINKIDKTQDFIVADGIVSFTRTF